MKIMPVGDYYVWYCEWCDSRNLTLWTRFEKNEIVCGACHRGIHSVGPGSVKSTSNQAFAAIL